MMTAQIHCMFYSGPDIIGACAVVTDKESLTWYKESL